MVLAGTPSGIISRLRLGLGGRPRGNRASLLDDPGANGGLKNGLCGSMTTVCAPSSSSMITVGIGEGIGSSFQSSRTELRSGSGRPDEVSGGESHIIVSAPLLEEEDSQSSSLSYTFSWSFIPQLLLEIGLRGEQEFEGNLLKVSDDSRDSRG